jgi:hypothetical protein
MVCGAEEPRGTCSPGFRKSEPLVTTPPGFSASAVMASAAHLLAMALTLSFGPAPEQRRWLYELGFRHFLPRSGCRVSHCYRIDSQVLHAVMPVDFNKLRSKKQKQAVVEPIEIFRRLPNRIPEVRPPVSADRAWRNGAAETGGYRALEPD